MWKKLLKLTVILIILLCVIGYGATKLSLNKYKENISSSVFDKLQLKVTIKGDIKIHILPTPYIELNEVDIYTLNDKELVQANKIYMHWKGLMLGNAFEDLKITDIDFDNAKINITAARDHLKKQQLNNPYLKNVIFKNSKINTDESIKNKKHLLNKFNAEFKINSLFNTNASFKSDFIYNNQPFNIDVYLKNIDDGASKNATFSIYNKAISIDFIGKTNNVYDDLNIAGDIKSKIVDFGKFSEYLSNIPYIKQIFDTENIELDGKFEATKNYISLKDVHINSQNIKDARLNFDIDLYEDMDSNINVEIESINLDGILSNSKSNLNNFEKFEDLSRQLINSFDFQIPINLSSTFAFHINNVTLYRQSLKDITFDVDLFNGNISLNRASFKFPGNSTFDLQGVVTYNQVRPIFNGTLELNCNNFSEVLSWMDIDRMYDKLYSFKNLIIKSEVTLIPHNLRFNNVRSIFGDLMMMGSSRIKQGNDDKISFISKLRLNKVDGNKFKMDKIFDDFITGLYISDIDKTGEISSKVTDDYRWLRQFKSNLNLAFSVDQFKFKDYAFNDFDFSLNVSNSNLNIDKIAARSQYADFNGYINLTLPTFRPLLHVGLSFDKLDTNFVDAIMPSSQTLTAALNNYLQNLPQNSTFKNILHDTNFYGANNYDGSISIKANQIKLKNFGLNNLDLLLQLNNGIIAVDKLDTNIFEGQVSIKGNIGVITSIPSIECSYAFYNINPGIFIDHFTGQNKMSGYMSISGSINTTGSDWPTFINKAQGSAAILGKKINFTGFDLGQLINASELETTYDDQLKRISYYSKYGNTLFDTIEGKIDISNGIITFTDFTLNNNRTSGIFVARYGIIDKLINAIARFSFIPVGKNSTLMVQYNTKGAVAEPSVDIDISQPLNFISNKSMSRINNTNSTPTLVDKQSVLDKRFS